MCACGGRNWEFTGIKLCTSTLSRLQQVGVSCTVPPFIWWENWEFALLSRQGISKEGMGGKGKYSPLLWLGQRRREGSPCLVCKGREILNALVIFLPLQNPTLLQGRQKLEGGDFDPFIFLPLNGVIFTYP